jgi:phosphatidylserine decarboxylase
MMKHAGKARSAAFKLIWLTLIGVAVLGFALRALLYFTAASAPHTQLPHGAWWNAAQLPAPLIAVLAALWLIFTLFTLYFFRDPTANPPAAPGLVVSPGHGTVDRVDTLDDAPFFGGPCHRISMFLSVINVHVQNAPIASKVGCVTHTPGKFVSALRTDCADYNENVLIGLESTELIGEKISLRLVAGVLARRIVPFVQVGDHVARGERISLIQFGSRCDIYIPPRYEIKVKPGDKVVGGETVIAGK